MQRACRSEAFVGLARKRAIGRGHAPVAATAGAGVTPMLLARRFTLNPVVVILSLIFWYWMWGVPGAILAMPMLAITKIICDRIRPLKALGHFLEGEESAAPRYVAAYTKNRSKTRS